MQETKFETAYGHIVPLVICCPIVKIGAGKPCVIEVIKTSAGNNQSLHCLQHGVMFFDPILWHSPDCEQCKQQNLIKEIMKQ